MKRFLPPGCLASLVVFSAMPKLHAANVTWDGNGDPNAGGAWEDAANWDTGVPTSLDDARLLNVGSGTRSVVINAPQIINRLTLTQTTVGVVNQLDLLSDLTISGNSSPFAITATAGLSSVVVNIGSGRTLAATNAGSITSTLGGTLNLGANSTFSLYASGATSDLINPTFGAVNATGTNGLISLKADRNAGTATFNGAVTTSGAGSSLTMRRLNSSDAVTTLNMNFTGNDGAGNSLVGEAGTVTNLQGTNSTLNFTNRVTLSGTSGANAGAILNFGGTTGNGTSVTNFNGGLVLGAGARAVGSHNGLAVNLNGTSTFASGSEFVVQYLGGQGAASFANAGNLTMTNADLNFDWAAPLANNATRFFNNTGTWVLEDGSSIAFTSSTGRPTFGFSVGANNNNSGNLSVKSGSTVGFQSLFNTGTLNLGSSTGGASDAEVVLGSPLGTFTNVNLKNGATSSDVDKAGTINVLGNAALGRTSYVSGGTTTLDNGDATSTGSLLNVGDGSTTTTFTLSNQNVVVNNAAGNTVTVNAGASVRLVSTATGSVAGSVNFNNSGQLNHIGTLVMAGNFNGARDVTVSSTGVYRIQGLAAQILAQQGTPGVQSTNVPDTRILLSGELTGSSADDRLTFVNSTGNANRKYLVMNATGAEINPGAGSGGTGISSIGFLELVDTNLTLSGGTALTFDIGGTEASGLYDEFKMTLATAGAGAILSLGSDSVLDIRMVNGYTAVTPESYLLIGASSITGSFSTLLFNGVLMTNEYTVNYLSDGLGGFNGVEVVFTAVPEPSTVLLLCGGLAVGLLRRRSGRRS
jgi:hypothetical protein